ncbi:MAG: tetratricopeptide repeat protein [Solirubrobacteraceae bacterium]
MRPDRLGAAADLALGLGLTAGLASVAFLTSGGVNLAPNTWAEIALTLLAAVLAAWTVLRGRAGRAWGGVTMGLILAVAGLTYASIAWSVAPSDSWVEANRTLSYVAAFAAALTLARIAPQRWPAVVGAVAAVATIVSGYALLVKVFPAALDPNDLLGRISAPFDYWNASGLIAALGLPACLWAGARRGAGQGEVGARPGTGERALRALSVPAIGVLVAAIVMSYSRGALLAAGLGLGCWFALVPLRLRGALVLILGAAGGAAISLWALSRHQFTHDHASLASRITAGHGLGLVLIGVLVLLSVAGLAATFAIDRWSLAPRERRRIGLVLLSCLALIPVGGVAGLAASSRGLTGEVVHFWATLTNPHSGVSDNPGRLVELGSTRPLYWSQGLKVGEHALVNGAGARGFGIAARPYVHASSPVQDAHSYVIETFADFGLIGLALNLALLVAWAIAAARAVDTRAGPRTPEQAAERAGLLTLLVVVIMFGLHSAIDWTWFVPGTALPALVCAGWLAGRGPLGPPAGRPGPAFGPPLGPPGPTIRPAPGLRRPTAAPGRYSAVLALAALALLAAWVIWQPLRSANADNAAIAALIHGNSGAAMADARAAVARDPISVAPLQDLSAVDVVLGNLAGARAEIAHATAIQPANPATWQALGEFDLRHHHASTALPALERARRLDPSSFTTFTDLAQARSELGARRPKGR